MNKPSDECEAFDEIEAMAERAERGEDVSAHFTNHHMAKQRVNIDFPLDLLRQIDADRAERYVRSAAAREHRTALADVVRGTERVIARVVVVM